MGFSQADSRHVLLLFDSVTEAKHVFDAVNPHVPVKTCKLSNIETISLSNVLLIVMVVDLKNKNNISGLRQILAKAHDVQIESLSVIDDRCRRDLVQLRSIGGTGYVSRPLTQRKLDHIVTSCSNSLVERSWQDLPIQQSSALVSSLRAFKGIMGDVANGDPIDNAEIDKSCQLIIRATQSDKLRVWVSNIKKHHNCTYSHCMMTCGYLVGFAQHIGVNGDELERIAIAGFVHDVGKIRIPQRILNKPARLTEAELSIMKRHPVIGHRMLKASGGFHSNVLRAALHHHEKIDGSGYPEGLKGRQISNFAMLTAIADVFSALTEQRTYKQARSPEEAYSLMLNMKGHLDMSLVHAFEPIAVRLQRKAA